MELREGTPGPLLHYPPQAPPQGRCRRTPRAGAAVSAAAGARPARSPRGLLDVLRLQLRAARGRGGHHQRARGAWATGWRSSTTAAAAWPPTATATWKPRRTSPARTCAASATSTASRPSSPNAAVAPATSRSTRSCWRTTRNGPPGPRPQQEDAQLQRVRPGEGRPAGQARGKRPRGQEPVVITYHDPCHLGKRYQNVCAQPRQILRSLDGYEFREAAESDSCCGAAGTYGVLHPETSAAIIDRKTGFIKDTGATVVATECPSCMMQLAYGLKRAGIDAEVVNVSQLCDEQLRGRSRRAGKGS